MLLFISFVRGDRSKHLVSKQTVPQSAVASRKFLSGIKRSVKSETAATQEVLEQRNYQMRKVSLALV